MYTALVQLDASNASAVGFVSRLSAFGDRPALVTPEGTLSYGDLAERVGAMAARIGTGRRLVLVTGGNDVDSVVAYLATLAGGHVALLATGGQPDNLAAMAQAYDPDLTVSGGRVWRHRADSAHDLHPELALLLSTSGSTGSPKLVRLSARNLEANAAAIASYLALRDTDVAATTLPMHYCYGLSVINSHLYRGAALLLTDLSVVDPCFWDLCRTHEVTSFAGVPYTYDLLERVGFDRIELPALRYLTQAGGRMAAEQVRRYAALGQRRGFDLFVMYGQTEATARMAYLPPDQAHAHPGAIGVPVPGGELRIDPVDQAHDDGVGELVYRGDNVMLGYAESPADLGLGRTVTELRTGDLARVGESGLYEIVGRRSRFAKVLGLRVDLDRAERSLAEAGVTGWCADGGDRVVVAAETAGTGDVSSAVEQVAASRWGLPASAVTVVVVAELPRLVSGKPDYRAIVDLAVVERAAGCGCTRAGCGCTGDAAVPEGVAEPVDAARLRSLYAQLLRRDPADVTDDDSFVSLGGDSLSYVEASIRLELLLGRLPAGWHLTSIRDLVRTGAPVRRAGYRAAWRSVEVTVLLRALAIVAIVGSHGDLFVLLGGAHLLLAVCGYNYARFQLSAAPRAQRSRRQLAGITRIVVPSVLWIGAVTAVSGVYPWQTALLVNGLLGPPGWTEPAWYYWFVEALVAILLGLLALTAVPAVDRLERRYPFALPVVLAVVGLLTRYDVVSLRDGDEIHRAHVVLWIFALGWAAARATTARHRLVVSALVIATVPGFFDSPARDAFVVLGVLPLTWVTQVRAPVLLGRCAGLLASASLYTYLSHWQVYPHLEDDHPFLAVVASLAGGVALWWVASRLQTLLAASITPWTAAPMRLAASSGSGQPASSQAMTASVVSVGISRDAQSSHGPAGI